MKIFLVGMPYSGKSSLGQQIAAELNLPFIDLDVEIEKREGKSISEIFSQDGEDHFRLVESTLLKEWAASLGSFVMATGGGAPCFYQGIEIINKAGVSIFLDVPVDELVRRVGSKSDRPLLNTVDQQALADKLTAMHSKRVEIYRKAALHFFNPTLPKILQGLDGLKGKANRHDII